MGNKINSKPSDLQAIIIAVAVLVLMIAIIGGVYELCLGTI